MSPEAERRIMLDDALIVDEIGIESGAYGIYRLRSRYQPIFERCGRSLHAAAVEGSVSPHIGGEEAPREIFLAATAEADMDFIGQMCLALPLRNHRNIGLDDIDLLVDVSDNGDPASLAGRARFIAGELPEAGVEPASVVCAIREPTRQDEAQLARLGDEIRGLGMRVAIGDFGSGRWTDGQIELVRPDMVRANGEWFGKVCRDAVTVRLLGSLVARLRERGAKVLISGIETEQQLGVALRSGADLFQGRHLAPPAHVGTLVVETVSLRAKLGSAEKVRALYG